MALDCRHYVAELYNADSAKLNDESLIREFLICAAEQANSSLIDVKTHSFSPQGITGFALLAESHISIHTWPEHNFAAVDAFTCGEHTDPEKACLYLALMLDAKGHSVTYVERMIPEFLSKSNA